MFNRSDVVTFRSKEELELLYDELVLYKEKAYHDAIMSLANKSFKIGMKHSANTSYKHSRYSLEGNDPGVKDGDRGHWLFCEEFFTNGEDSVPSLFGV